MVLSAKHWSLILFVLAAACTSKNSAQAPRKGASADTKKKSPATSVPADEIPTDPTLKKVIPFAEKGLNLGPKTALKCGPKKAEGKLPLGHYLTFEVLEDGTKFNLAMTNFCGELYKAKITLFKVEDREPILTFPLPTTPIENADLSFDSIEMTKGRYILAFEVSGRKISELSTLGLEKGSLTFNKFIRFESAADF